MTAAPPTSVGTTSPSGRPDGTTSPCGRPDGTRSPAARPDRPRQIDHRVDRLGRHRRSEVDTGLLTALRARIQTVPLIAASATEGNAIAAAELTFLDGFSLRLAPCHRPAIATLSDAIAAGRLVTLQRAVRPGRLWALGFVGPEPLPVLAGRAWPASGGGARRTRVRIPVGAGPIALACGV